MPGGARARLFLLRVVVVSGMVWESVLRELENAYVEQIMSTMKQLEEAVAVSFPMEVDAILEADVTRLKIPDPVTPVEPLVMPPALHTTPTYRFRSGADSQEAVVPPLGEILKEQLVAALTQGIDLAVGGPLVAVLSAKLEDTVRQPLAAAIARGAAAEAVPELSKSLTESISTIVVPRLVETPLPTQRTATALTKSMIRSVTMASATALSRPPIADYYCYYCKSHDLYCKLCASTMYHTHVGAYRAGFLSDIYARYYGAFYGDYASRLFVSQYFTQTSY